MPRPAIKPRPCRVCGEDYTPRAGLQVCCSIRCAITQSREKQAKAADKLSRERLKLGRESLKTRSDWMGEAHTSINSYVRARDRGRPCVSCGKPDDGSHQRHASHYRSRGACSSLRFNLKNIHSSCQQCNSTLSGNLIEYRVRLVARFGSDYVDWLECQNDTVKYDIEYLKRMKRIFNKRARYYMKRRSMGIIAP